MAKVNISMLQGMGALANGFYRHDLRSAFPGPVYMGLGYSGLGAGCPEGSHMVNGKCECYEGRVWMPDGSRCVSPQSPAYTGAITWQDSMEGQTPDTYGQQELTAQARKVIEQAGLTINCKIDDSWFAGPQGGQPSRVCSISGSPYQFGAYAINLNPQGAITDYFQWKAVQQIEQATGIPGGALRSTPETTALIQEVARTGVVSDAGAKKAVESIQKLQERGIPEWGIQPQGQYPTPDAQTGPLGPSGTNQQPGEVSAQYTSSPYTGSYYQGSPNWTPPPTDYFGAPTDAYSGGGGGAGAALDLSAIPSWAWLAGGVAAFYLMSK